MQTSLDDTRARLDIPIALVHVSCPCMNENDIGTHQSFTLTGVAHLSEFAGSLLISCINSCTETLNSRVSLSMHDTKEPELFTLHLTFTTFLASFFFARLGEKKAWLTHKNVPFTLPRGFSSELFCNSAKKILLYCLRQIGTTPVPNVLLANGV